MSFVICMNDYPVATAETEQKANEARAYIQRIYDMIYVASTHGSKVYIHVHEVPEISGIEGYHDVFTKSGGRQYQHILNNLMHRVSYPLASTVPILNAEEATELFKNFRKTYPAIDDFIKRTQDEGWSVRPKEEVKEEPNYWAKAEKYLDHSNCLKRKYGCVIVKDGVVISSGFNKSRVPCTSCAREGTPHNTGTYEECHAIHAEQMALLKAPLRDLQGAKLYLVCNEDDSPTPCPTCQKLMDYCGVTLAVEPLVSVPEVVKDFKCPEGCTGPDDGRFDSTQCPMEICLELCTK